MSAKEKVNNTLRMMNDVFDAGRLWGKAEAYDYMIDILKKSHLKNSNPKLVLQTFCLALDSGTDALEKVRNFLQDSSPTMTNEIDILIETISSLSDNVRIATDEGRYKEAFNTIKKASREVERFTKEHETTFQVFMEVSRKRLEDMFK